MGDQNGNGHKSNKMAQKESEELDHLWKNYVDSSGRLGKRRQWGRPAEIVAALLLIVGALFVDDHYAWSAVRVVVDVLNDAADDVADALGVQRN
jgi:hypothetical protein